MKGGNYDVLLLRPQDIADVIDIGKAIDLVEQGYREAQDFRLINAPRLADDIAVVCQPIEHGGCHFGVAVKSQPRPQSERPDEAVASPLRPQPSGAAAAACRPRRRACPIQSAIMEPVSVVPTAVVAYHF
jgi:hypothetical protein